MIISKFKSLFNFPAFSSIYDVQPNEILSILKGSNFSALVGIVNAIIIAICIWPNGNELLLSLWLASSILLFCYIAYRSHLARNYKPKQVSPRAVWRAVWLALLYAVPWIFLTIVTLVKEDEQNILLVLMLSIGMSAGSAIMLYRVPLAAFACAGTIIFAIVGAMAFRNIADLWPVTIYSLTYSMVLVKVILTSWRIAREREESLVKITKANEEIRRLAERDHLTGLYNRKFFIELLEQWTTDNKIEKFAVFILDLDRFKNINDTIGHSAGDELLLIVSKRLHASVAGSNVIARFGGDEFAIAIDLSSGTNSVEEAAQNILNTLNQLVEIARTHIHPNASIGIALYPDHSKSPDELTQIADIALLQAKENGRGQFKIYNTEMAISVARMDEIEITFRESLEKNQLKLYYQPKFILDTGELAGAEAVLRWINTDKAPANTYHMIEVAEIRGMIPLLSEYIFDEFLEDLKILECCNSSDIPISLNIHPFELKTPEILIKRLKSIESAGLPLTNIILEISESSFVGRGSDDVRLVLDMFSELGVRISLDDFGLGNASLSHINGLSLSEIKIDRQFTNGFFSELHKKAILSATFELARSLGINCTAMGISSETQASQLRTINTLGKSLIGQGRLWTEPMIAADFAVYCSGNDRKLAKKSI